LGDALAGAVKNNQADKRLMVSEHVGEHESQWAAIVSFPEKVGMTAETLCKLGAPRRGGCRPASGSHQ
jgi:hypothetical protein